MSNRNLILIKSKLYNTIYVINFALVHFIYPSSRGYDPPGTSGIEIGYGDSNIYIPLYEWEVLKVPSEITDGKTIALLEDQHKTYCINKYKDSVKKQIEDLLSTIGVNELGSNKEIGIYDFN
jgi:hypothetical protein